MIKLRFIQLSGSSLSQTVNAMQRREPLGGWVKKKADIEYPFEHVSMV
jgi:hypothetical protein